MTNGTATGEYDSDNVFARILRGEAPCKKVYEDEQVLAFHDIRPEAPYMFLLYPRAAMKLEGIFTALATPFRDDLSLDERALVSFVDRQISSGISGIVPCGTTGESTTLNFEEYCTVVRLCVETAGGRVPVIAGTGSNCTTETIVSNVAPSMALELYNLHVLGKIDKAKRVSGNLAALSRVLFIEPSPSPTKYALSLMGRMRPKVRLPMIELTSNSKIAVRNVLETLDLLQAVHNQL
ncbi:hypothetical protein GH714_042609 [Hevea brasiliensis]|uniref:HIT domain-containing protein n=1 Tax=Hevea brasiliensis TaxID=3981 RepID=A0A6A6K005_HEVBR|nr:hypothetical protein GH714_042609 [Hevea brasiliensis]